jgi:hypothetical protein
MTLHGKGEDFFLMVGLGDFDKMSVALRCKVENRCRFTKMLEQYLKLNKTSMARVNDDFLSVPVMKRRIVG